MQALGRQADMRVTAGLGAGRSLQGMEAWMDADATASSDGKPPIVRNVWQQQMRASRGRLLASPLYQMRCPLWSGHPPYAQQHAVAPLIVLQARAAQLLLRRGQQLCRFRAASSACSHIECCNHSSTTTGWSDRSATRCWVSGVLPPDT